MSSTTTTTIELSSGALLHLEGAPNGPPVLFLHGVGGGAWSWRPQRAALAGDYRLYVWEARGHGDARRVPDAGLADYYADAREALAAVAQRSGPAHVVAHSMGGLLAIALACDDRERVRSLFLIDPVYSDGTSDSYGHMPPGVGRVALFVCEPLLRSFERDGAMARWLSRRFFRLAFTDRERMEAAWVDQRRQVPVEYQRMLRESFTSATGFELREFAREIDVPVLVLDCLRKAQEPRFPVFLAALRERLGDRFEAATLRGGHYLQLDRPDEVNDLLTRFLSSRAMPLAR